MLLLFFICYGYRPKCVLVLIDYRLESCWVKEPLVKFTKDMFVEMTVVQNQELWQ